MAQEVIKTDLLGEHPLTDDVPDRFPNKVWDGATILAWMTVEERFILQIANGDGYVIRFGMVDIAQRLLLTFNPLPHTFFVRITLLNGQRWAMDGRRQQLLPGQLQLRCIHSPEEVRMDAGKSAFIDAFCNKELAEYLAKLFPALREFLARAESEGSAVSPAVWAPPPVMEQVYNCLQFPNIASLERHLTGDRLIDLMTVVLKTAFDGSPKLDGIRADHRAAVYEVRWVIETGLEKHHSIAQLAAACGTSPFLLKTVFKKLFGSGTFAFLRRRRMNKAMLLLKRSDSSIKVITNEVGFADVSTFTQAFRQHFNTTPGKIRKEMALRAGAQDAAADADAGEA